MPTARELLEQADALMRKNRVGPASEGPGRPPGQGTRPPSAGPGLPVSPRPIQREPILPSVARTSLPVDPTVSPEMVPRATPAPPPVETAPALPDDFVFQAGPMAGPSVPQDEIATLPATVSADRLPAASEPGREPASELPGETGTSPRAVDDNDPAPELPVSSVDADGFPLLTDTIDGPATDPGVAALHDGVDDVPLLTDVVEEIDVGIAEEARGEPSLWELTSRGETSVLGPAPESIIVVPPPVPLPLAVPQNPPEHGRDPLGFDQPPPGYLPPEDSPAAAATADASVDGAASIPTPEAAQDALWSPPPGGPEMSQEADSFASMAPAQALLHDAGTKDGEEAAFGVPSVPDFPPATEAEPPAPDATEARDGSLPAAQEASWRADDAPATAPPMGAAEPPAEAALAPLPSISEGDEARIREIAEEIGMQVLQRIDIFTDTTLRAQLGERLRPVVDRAAADLVAAINEHVGELLRVSISEAIEREIESWRDQRR